MPDLFDSPAMAAGYARSRPPVHPHIIERVVERLNLSQPVARALDVGCGAGLSTRPLLPIARQCIGIEPVDAMVRLAASTMPEASFIVGGAETLPVRPHSVDLITAAGSLNYADIDRFFPEAVRILQPGGVLVIYDFSQGKSFRHSPKLDDWYTEFVCRYPPPSDGSRRELDPDILAACNSGLQTGPHEWFEIGLALSPAFYVGYALTETNVAQAIRNGIPAADIRAWCAETLAPVFDGNVQEVLFRGYFVCLTAA